MKTEITANKPRPIEYTFNGKPLAVRNMSLKLGIRLQTTPDDQNLVAEIISESIVDEQGKPALSVEDVMNGDAEMMMKLFREISGTSVKDAEKN